MLDKIVVYRYQARLKPACKAAAKLSKVLTKGVKMVRRMHKIKTLLNNRTDRTTGDFLIAKKSDRRNSRYVNR